MIAVIIPIADSRETDAKSYVRLRANAPSDKRAAIRKPGMVSLMNDVFGWFVIIAV